MCKYVPIGPSFITVVSCSYMSRMENMPCCICNIENSHERMF